MTWPTVKLAEVARIDRIGIDPKKIDSDTKYLGLEHIESGGEILGAQTVSNGDLASTKFRFDAGHILYGKLRPYLAKIALPDFSGICSTDILPIKSGKQIDRRFLAHFLRMPNNVALATSRSTGVNLPRLSPKALADFDVPLPPLEDQRRIAAILDKADGLRRRHEQSLALADDFLKSVFLEMVGNQNRGGWAHEELGCHLDFVTSGSRGWARYYAEKGARFIRSLDVQMNEISDEEVVYVNPPPSAEADRARVKIGDVLLTITGSRIGRVADITELDGDAYISQHVAIIRVRQTILPSFLSYFLSNESLGQRQIGRMQYGQTKPGLNLQQIRSFVLPVPPLDVQRRFTNLLAKVRRQKGAYRNQLAQSNGMFFSLSQRAFRGEL